jgi:DNA-binding response OmpR family regulator
MHLLLVEDDLNLGKALTKRLADHTRVHWVRTLESARGHFAAGEYDLVMLDLGLPDGDGIGWLRELRAANVATPVLIVTARDAVDDRVRGLDSGADDYLVKPFEADELLARVRALMRRGTGSAGPEISVGELRYEPAEHRFSLGTTPLTMTPSEHSLLAALIRSGTRPVSRERLARELYGDSDRVDSNALEVHIHNLRKLIGRERIETVRGFGYRLATS